MSKRTLTLELGDIININAPSNPEFNNEIFLIDYIDIEKRIDLINTNTLNKKTLTLSSGIFDDKSIKSINLLDRSKNVGYAAQNDLNLGTWIDIFFGGDIPYSITGQITDKIEDMIEIQNYENEEKLYLDFEYKGIPDDIPINAINIRSAPQSALNKSIVDKFITNEQSGLNVFDQMQREQLSSVDEDTGDINSNLVDDDDIDGLNVQISEGDQIAYGAALDDIYYYVEVDKEEKLYSIDDQLQDLQDDILATIPSTQRNYQTNLEVNQLLNRFKELREKFSIEVNGILKPKLLTSKPIINTIQDGVNWLIPVVKHDLKILSDEEWLEQHETKKQTFETSSDSNNRYLELLENLKGCDSFRPNRSRVENLTEYIPNFRKEIFYVGEQDNNSFITETYLPNQYRIHPSGNRTINSEGDLLIPTAYIQTSILHIDYTRTSLSQTDLLIKAIKPQVNLWEILSNEDINPNIIELNNDLLQRSGNSTKYYNNITHHLILNKNDDDDDEAIKDNDRFSKMMNAIVPKTNDIISNISGYYGNVYNVQSFIEQLHLFKIDEITRSNQQLIIKAINSNIKAYNDDRKKSMSAIKVLATTKYETNFKKQILDILLQSIKSQIGEITNAYGFGNMTNLSNSEIFNEMMKQDNFYLLSIIISNLNAGLLITNNVNEIIEEHKLQLKSKYNPENDTKNKKCEEYVIAKRYNSQEALDQDNGGAVAYYDMEFDNTPYILKDDYYTEISTLTDEEAIVFIQKKLMENLNMSESIASNTAKIIFDGKKPIADGLYAILDTVDDTTDKLQRSYFVRRENMWVAAEMDDNAIFVSNNKDICNLQTDCLTTTKGCISTENATNQIETNFVEDIMSDFNVSDITLTKEALQEKFNQQYAKQVKTIVRLREIKNSNKLIYDRQQKSIGMMVEDTEPIISPYARLLDKIIGQYDFKKKNEDIIKFYETFCRIPTQDEEQYWYYCKVTHVKLMPSFMKTLASAFTRGDYVNEVNRICAEQGGLSDDGNAWIDKHSGYKIKDIEYNEDEGYDDTGFKAISRALLEADVGDDILKDVIDTNDVRSDAYNEARNSPLQKMVSNIIKTLLLQMGIEYDTSIIEIDIQNTILKLIENNTKDIETVKIGKVIIYVTISYLLIVLQTAIPPIKTKKTFPGCAKSFSGYPYEGSSDKSGLEYIACVALGIKSSIFPWNTLKKTKKTDLVEKLYATIIPKYLMNEFKVRDMIANKKKFMKTYKDPQPDFAYNLDRWNTFLPPLRPKDITATTTIGRTFEGELTSDIKTGKRHNEKLDLIKNKVYFASVTIQNRINSIVKEQTPLMITMSNIPFVENACCQEYYKTISYFSNKNNEINDGPIRSMMSLYHKYNRLSKASILYDPVDTRKSPINDFPGYSEEIIYRTFIGHCKYNSQEEPPEHVKSVCQRRPDNYKSTDSISNKIRSLKNNGVQYTEEHFKELLNILNKKNLIESSQDSDIKFNVQDHFDELIEQIEDYEPDETNTEFKLFIQNIKKTINGKDTNEKMKQYLVKQIENIKKLLLKELKKCNKQKIAIQVFEYLLNDSIHHESYMTSVKNSILNITNILPNMLLNKTTFEEGANIPRHWNISENHSADIKTIIEKQNNIKTFFDNETLKRVSYKISTTNNLITAFTTCIYNMQDFDTELKEQILQFTLMFILKQFITVSIDDVTDIKTKVKAIGRPANEGIMESFGGEEIDFVEADVNIDDIDSRRKLLAEIITICDNELKHTLLPYDAVVYKVNKAKIIEKDRITQFLNALTIEEREIENLFKNNKLEKWSVGLQKGLRIYDKETYDRETQDKNMFAIIEEDRVQQEIDDDNALHMVDDDDHGELDGDEAY
tara:strand:+ start:16438 stop:21981 length:5544 start_codon:yes stop_codon:yes gene_type:complete